MIIRSKKTKLEHEISTEEWEQIKSRGDSSNYVIVKADTKQINAPDDVAAADYNNIVKQANAAMKKKQHEKAFDLFTQANGIKPTALIQEKLSELEEILEK